MKITLDSDHLAMLLACSTEVGYPPRSREDIGGIWLEKSIPRQYAYRLRAVRLIKAWLGVIPSAPPSESVA